MCFGARYKRLTIRALHTRSVKSATVGAFMKAPRVVGHFCMILRSIERLSVCGFCNQWPEEFHEIKQDLMPPAAGYTPGVLPMRINFDPIQADKRFVKQRTCERFGFVHSFARDT